MNQCERKMQNSTEKLSICTRKEWYIHIFHGVASSASPPSSVEMSWPLKPNWSSLLNEQRHLSLNRSSLYLYSVLTNPALSCTLLLYLQDTSSCQGCLVMYTYVSPARLKTRQGSAPWYKLFVISQYKPPCTSQTEPSRHYWCSFKATFHLHSSNVLFSILCCISVGYHSCRSISSSVLKSRSVYCFLSSSKCLQNKRRIFMKNIF